MKYESSVIDIPERIMLYRYFIKKISEGNIIENKENKICGLVHITNSLEASYIETRKSLIKNRRKLSQVEKIANDNFYNLAKEILTKEINTEDLLYSGLKTLYPIL